MGKVSYKDLRAEAKALRQKEVVSTRSKL
jgi:hypothetical protein